jgi:hypothetical protein
VCESRCGDFRQMFMLRNGEYLLFCEAAHAYAISERDHVAIPDEPLRTDGSARPLHGLGETARYRYGT